MVIQRLSRLFLPRVIVPPGKEKGGELSAVSQKLLGNLGIVKSNAGGTNVLLPVALRSLDKLSKIIKEELEKVGAQEISLPSLTPHSIFKETGRGDLPELFRLKDRHNKQLVLGPTHEEAVVELVASAKASYRDLPWYLYQISNKFRDEIKPRFGLMRSKEFLMKDLYCFEATPAASLASYNRINVCYNKIFERLGVPYCMVEGSTGDIGGELSHEFHLLSNVGEDKVIVCADCGHGKNEDSGSCSKYNQCSSCSGSNLHTHQAIEVGHSFLLGTRYSKPLKATFTAADRSQQYFEMSCHGIGLSRLVAASVEVLSSPQEIKWPLSIAPYLAVLIPPKAGSKEEKTEIPVAELTSQLSQLLGKDLVVDDRTDLTIGKRITEAKQMGFPFLIIIGKAAIDQVPKVEFCDVYNATSQLIQPSDAVHLIKQKLDERQETIQA